MNDKVETQRLSDLIKDNPGCYVSLDNDCWTMTTRKPPNIEDMDEFDKWLADNTIAKSYDYGVYRGNLHGRAILYALANIQGIVVEPV